MLTKRRIIIQLMALMLVTGLSAVAFTQVFAGPPPPQPLISGTFRGWKYTVWADADRTNFAQVEYNSNSVEALRTYAAENKELAGELRQSGVTQQAIRITFKRPIDLDEFRTLVNTFSLKVDAFAWRAVTKDQRRITIFGSPSEGQVVSIEHLTRIVNQLAYNGAVDLRGIISVDGILSAAEYNKLAKHPDVFLIDVTRSAIRQHLSKVAPNISLDDHRILIPPTYPYMEDHGLSNFQ